MAEKTVEKRAGSTVGSKVWRRAVALVAMTAVAKAVCWAERWAVVKAAWWVAWKGCVLVASTADEWVATRAGKTAVVTADQSAVL
jgi:hypothetical protein